MEKPRLVSGIQPTGKLHLGNYLGMVKNSVTLQNSGKYDCYFFIADLHSLTQASEPEEKKEQIHNLFADILALGLNPKKSVIFQQSQVPDHTEFSWILETITPLGELSRMTQFKDKGGFESGSNVGLLTYPVLMASDILLYDAKYVPVGEDQLQHLELTRTLARKFNSRFGNTLLEPEALMTETPRVMSLQDPLKKMSKSDPKGCVFLDDSPEEIEAKIKVAATDSGSEIIHDPEEKPGISNMLRIYAALSDKFIPDIEEEFKGKNYSEFKGALAQIIADHFAPFRESKKQLLKDDLSKLLEAGSKKAEKIASKKIDAIKEKVGISI